MCLESWEGRGPGRRNCLLRTRRFQSLLDSFQQPFQANLEADSEMRLTGLRSGVGRAAFLPEAPGLTLFLAFSSFERHLCS